MREVRGLAGLRDDAPISNQAPLVSRVPKGPEGLAVVPVGGGRARAGLEIDHSEPSGSRVAISRAGRRPPAHTAARPFKAGLRRPEHQRGHKHQHAAQTARGRAAAHGHTKQPGPTKNTHANAIVHSFTATLPKVI